MPISEDTEALVAAQIAHAWITTRGNPPSNELEAVAVYNRFKGLLALPRRRP